MSNILENIRNFFMIYRSLDPLMWVSTIVEILLIAFVIYKFLVWIKNTRAWSLLRGIFYIIVFVIIAYVFQFSVILWILQHISGIAVIAIVIIFQDEIRNAIEHLGRQKIFSKLLPDLNKYQRSSDNAINKIIEAAFRMGRVKTGALMVIEQGESLEHIEKTGIALNAEVSAELLINIFEKNTPLHDGAVMIVGDKIKCATAYLPLSDNFNISKSLGTRHRAALGISEVSDAIVIVVSEETGKVSYCYRGNITEMENEKELKKVLFSHSKDKEDDKDKNIIEQVEDLFIKDEDEDEE